MRCSRKESESDIFSHQKRGREHKFDLCWNSPFWPQDDPCNSKCRPILDQCDSGDRGVKTWNFNCLGENRGKRGERGKSWRTTHLQVLESLATLQPSWRTALRCIIICKDNEDSNTSSSSSSSSSSWSCWWSTSWWCWWWRQRWCSSRRQWLGMRPAQGGELRRQRFWWDYLFKEYDPPNRIILLLWFCKLPKEWQACDKNVMGIF